MQYPQHPLPHISINLSATQFEQTDFAETMIRTLRELKADTSRLTLELTESMLLGNIEQTVEKMRKLKEIGISFAVDDFGTGCSSLAYLKRLPLDQIKIDRSFVKDIPHDVNDTALVEMLVSLSAQLNLDVVAEGVETAEAVSFLRERACRALQGYYFSKPIPIPEFEKSFIQNRDAIFL
jgi:EAL domain-containing protein (putative c-di-GMP-specific phosphodiesterase class I)